MHFIIIGAVAVILLIWIIAINNSLVRKKMYVGEAWSGIDIQLKRKANIIPNLVDTLKMQTDYESDLLTNLTKARTGITSGSNEERMKANDDISKMIPSVYAVAENYPVLGANESFRKLMTEVSDCEDKITYARNRYNISVTGFNTAIRIFPNSIFANMKGYKEEPFFEIPDNVRVETDNMRIKDL